MNNPFVSPTGTVAAGSVTVPIPKGAVVRQISVIADPNTACTLKVGSAATITVPKGTAYSLSKEELANLVDTAGIDVVIGAVCASYVVAYAEAP